MAGLGKYKKGAAFTLKSGNKPSFLQMGSTSGASPITNYSAPLKTGDDKENPNAVVPEETEAEKRARLENEKEKQRTKPADKLGVKIAKIAANAAIGGFDAVTGSETRRPTINFGPEKGEEESDALTPGQKALLESSTMEKDLEAKADKEEKAQYDKDMESMEIPEEEYED